MYNIYFSKIQKFAQPAEAVDESHDLRASEHDPRGGNERVVEVAREQDLQRRPQTRYLSVEIYFLTFYLC